ncbi:MAG: NADH-quinone oxidoreductase subunit N [Candidatus Zixiibacteriota bacterium]
MELDFPRIDYAAIAPELIIGGFALLVMLVAPFMPREKCWLTGHISWIGIMAACLAVWFNWGSDVSTFAGLYTIDLFSSLFKIIFLLGSLLVIFMSDNYVRLRNLPAGEYYALILFATLGMMMMASAADLIVFFVGLEIMSVALYVLAGFRRNDLKSNEASLKYFLLGAFATGFLVFGIAFIYGALGTTSIAQAFSSGSYAFENSGLFLMIGGGLLLIGLAFKLASFPFHMWVPDVYEGSPTTITAFMSAGPKAAAIAVMARVFIFAFGEHATEISSIFWSLSVMTMFTGNLIALSQTNVKRMLAYSSIAHAGYMLIAFATASSDAVSAVAFYMLCYTVMNIGAFMVLIIVESKSDGDNDLTSFTGLGRRHPILAATMALFLISLAGIPPTAGFTAKFMIFKAAILKGHIPLVVIAVINTLISVYYYLRVVVVMFMIDTETEYRPVTYPAFLFVALVIAVMGVFALGMFPGTLFPLDQPLLATFH